MDVKDDQITLKEVFKIFFTDTENKIMKKLSLIILGLLVLISCSQDTQIEDYDSFRIEGSVTKGSFLPGATIEFTELDDKSLAQKG
ncbi:MAG: hypothetical protein CMC19_01030, partial [Flavobacteriaceae bacterium]|nr:hypothetical protein [Flavobacteriaceae bacterium]